jgi:hypothetical protein
MFGAAVLQIPNVHEVVGIVVKEWFLTNTSLTDVMRVAGNGTTD